jgi:MerR family transcriptional regulator, light-induced transcriptional regulator
MTTISRALAGTIAGTMSDRIADRVWDLQSTRQPEFLGAYSEYQKFRYIEGVHYHLRYLVEAMWVGDARLFTDFAAWLAISLLPLGVPLPALVASMSCLADVLDEALDPAVAALARQCLEAGIAALRETPTEVPSYIGADQVLGRPAMDYLAALLRGDRGAASAIVTAAIEGGIGVPDLYLHLFQTVQYEVGRLWQTGRITVAQEHYCTSATQTVMSQLYPIIFDGRKDGRTMVATCTAGDLHEIGIRMVADLAELDGWDTWYLGANTHAASVVKTVRDVKADVLAISATMAFHVGSVAETIRLVRTQADLHHVKILVGGRPFNTVPTLWKSVGADGHGADARETAKLANALVGRP